MCACPSSLRSGCLLSLQTKHENKNKQNTQNLKHASCFSTAAAPAGRRVAPEVLMGGRNCTQAVDIYSFSVMLFELFTGECVGGCLAGCTLRLQA